MVRNIILEAAKHFLKKLIKTTIFHTLKLYEVELVWRIFMTFTISTGGKESLLPDVHNCEITKAGQVVTLNHTAHF